MQVQKIQNNNNYNTSFKEKLIIDRTLISRMTREEKYEMALLKKMFKENGQKGKIKVKNYKKLSVQEIIENLKSKFGEIDKEQAKLRKIEDGLG